VKLPKLPKLWRKRKGKGKGHFVGNYIVKVGGTEVNLRTQVLDGPDGAIERSKQAQNGRRNFRDDLDQAVDQMETAPAPALPLPPPELPRPAAAAPAAAPPPVTPDAVISPLRPPLQLPPVNDAAEEAAATSAAAAETASDAGDPGAQAPPPVDQEVLDSFLRQGADLLVDLQLGLQASLIKRRTGKIAAPVPLDSKLRTIAADAWIAQLKIWLPDNVQLPPLAIALLIPVLAMPQQMHGATDPPKQEETPADVDIPAAA
jgi:hypothetical protein